MLDGLRGYADQDDNGLITATELFDYIQPRVSCETSADGTEGQMPFLDYIRSGDIYHPGNFVFLLPNVALDQGEKETSNRGYYEGDDRKEGSTYKRIIEKLPILVTILIITLVGANYIHPFFQDRADRSENLMTADLASYSPYDNLQKSENLMTTDLASYSPYGSPKFMLEDMPGDEAQTFSQITDMVSRGNFEDALNKLNNISSTYPQYDGTTYYMKGWALNKKGFWEINNHPEKANNTLLAAWNALEASSRNSYKSIPDVYVLNEMGNTYYYLGKVQNNNDFFNQSIELKDKAIKADPSRDFVWYDKGIILLDQKRCNEAIKAFDEAIKLNPNDVQSKELRENANQCALDSSTFVSILDD